MRVLVSEGARSRPRAARVNLREVREGDFAFLVALRRDSALQAQLLTVPDSVEPAALMSWIERRRAEPGGAFLVVEDAATGEARGYVQITNVHRKNGTAYGGIVLAADARGQGYGREALAALLEFAKTELGLRKLLAEIRKDNIASTHLHLALGYREAGLLERHFVDMQGEPHDVVLVERLLGEA